MKFDIVIGNPPYQKSESESTNTVELYTQFYKLAYELASTYVLYVIPFEWANRNTSKFKKSLFGSNSLREITLHDKKWFDIGKQTCNIFVDKTKTEPEVIIKRSSDATQTASTLTHSSVVTWDLNVITPTEDNLGARWKRGNVSINQLNEVGTYPVVYSLGGRGDIKILYSDIETSGLGSWKVCIGNMGSWDAIGHAKVIGPEHAVNYSIVYFECGSEEEAIALKTYIDSDYVKGIIKAVKASTPNSKSTFTAIPNNN